MELSRRAVDIPLFLKLRDGVLHDARAIIEGCRPEFDRPLIVTQRRYATLATEVLQPQWSATDVHVIEGNTSHDCAVVERLFLDSEASFILGCGGGRALDVGKYAATRLAVNFVSAPLAPSHDGIVSPVAVIADKSGTSQSLPARMPAGLIVDLAVLAAAPEESVVAGTGDLISNLSAVADWRLAECDKGEAVDDYALLLSEQSAQLVLRYLAGEGSTSDPQYRKALVEGLILSGIAMNIAGNSRPASGAEHEFSHAIDALFPRKAVRHGLQVAFGMLIAEKVRGNDLAELKGIFAKVGLPISYQSLGLSLDEAAQALHHAPATRPGRYTIFEKAQLTLEQCRELLSDL